MSEYSVEMPDISSMMMRNLNWAPNLRCDSSFDSSILFRRALRDSRVKSLIWVGESSELWARRSVSIDFCEQGLSVVVVVAAVLDCCCCCCFELLERDEFELLLLFCKLWKLDLLFAILCYKKKKFKF